MPQADFLGDPLEGTQPEGDGIWWRKQAENAESQESKNTISTNAIKISNFTEYLRNKYYVSCWHMNSQENPDMWKYYTSKPESLAISTTYKKLCVSLPNYVNIGVVRYIDYRTESISSISMNVLEYITHKDVKFSFENEVRAVASSAFVTGTDKTKFAENFFASETNPNFVVFAPIIESRNLIDTVVLNPNCTKEFALGLKDICEAKSIVQPLLSMYR